MMLQGTEVCVNGEMLRSHRTNKMVSQIVTCDTPWPRYTTPWAPARQELPFAWFTLEQVEAAAGVDGNKHHELPAVASMQSLPLQNNPAVRPELLPTPPQVATNRPRPGQFGDFFRRTDGDEYSFNAHEHGDWVSVRLRQLKLPSGKADQWRVHADQFLAEIELWIKTNGDDLKRAARWHERGKHDTFSARARTWIIPEAALAEFARGKVFDTRAFFEAAPADREHIQIDLQDWSIPGETTWDTDQIWKLGIESGVTDIACLSDLCKDGVTLPFNGESSILLAPCSAAFYEMLPVCQKKAREELEEGLLLSALQGIPLFPIKISPRSIATQFKEGAYLQTAAVQRTDRPYTCSTHTAAGSHERRAAGKIKHRPVANLSYPQKQGQEHHSVNHGYDM